MTTWTMFPWLCTLMIIIALISHPARPTESFPTRIFSCHCHFRVVGFSVTKNLMSSVIPTTAMIFLKAGDMVNSYSLVVPKLEWCSFWTHHLPGSRTSLLHIETLTMSTQLIQGIIALNDCFHFVFFFLEFWLSWILFHTLTPIHVFILRAKDMVSYLT